MSIQKKSLISTLKTAKKANVASSTTNEIDPKGAKVASMRYGHLKAGVGHSSMRQLKSSSYKTFKKQ